MDGSAALRPLEEASAELDRLTHYASTGELASAVEAVERALERSLRIYLRTHPRATDADRMVALSEEQLAFDGLVQSLRTRDLISLELAGTVHELRSAAERARSGNVKAADADVATRAVHRVRAELGAEHRASAPQGTGSDGAGAGEVAAGASAGPSEEAGEEAVLPENRGRWMAWLAAGLAVLVFVALALVLSTVGEGEADAAVQAFRAGRLDSARVAFERVLVERPADVSARLYLARIHRRQGRTQEAAEALRTAVELAPEDADVRRELGHLFMDLGSWRSAAAQYERSLEYDAENSLTWIAYIRALRAAEDPRAARMLESAPADVRAALGGSD